MPKESKTVVELRELLRAECDKSVGLGHERAMADREVHELLKKLQLAEEDRSTLIATLDRVLHGTRGR